MWHLAGCMSRRRHSLLRVRRGHRHPGRRRRGNWGSNGLLLRTTTPYHGALSDNIFDHAHPSFKHGVTSKVDVAKWALQGEVLVLQGAQTSRRDHRPNPKVDIFPLRYCWVGDLLARCPAKTGHVLRSMYGTLASHPVVKQPDGSYVSHNPDDVVCFLT